jgi:predicted GIY-YIG superfamily endonuclease
MSEILTNIVLSKMAGYVYKISFPNGKFYIGSTYQKDNLRKTMHFHQLRKKKHYNKHLQKNFNIYGEKFTKFQIIQNNIEVEILREVEQIWIGALCALHSDNKKGLNICAETNFFLTKNIKRKPHTKLTKFKISSSLKGKKQSKEQILNKEKGRLKTTFQYDLQGNFVKEWNRVSEIAKNFDLEYFTLVRKIKQKKPISGFLFLR